MESLQNARFMVTRSEVRNLPEVTSHLISKLYKLWRPFWFFEFSMCRARCHVKWIIALPSVQLLRLDMMLLPVDCIPQAIYHKNMHVLSRSHVLHMFYGFLHILLTCNLDVGQTVCVVCSFIQMKQDTLYKPRCIKTCSVVKTHWLAVLLKVASWYFHKGVGEGYLSESFLQWVTNMACVVWEERCCCSCFSLGLFFFPSLWNTLPTALYALIITLHIQEESKISFISMLN